MGGEVSSTVLSCLAEDYASNARAILRITRQPCFDEYIEKGTKEELHALRKAILSCDVQTFRSLMDDISRRELIDKPLHDLRIIAKSLRMPKWSRATSVELVAGIRRAMNEKR